MSKLTAVKLARMQQGLTLKELGCRTGYAKSTLCNLEQGNVRPWAKIEAAVSNALGLPRELLFQEQDHVDVGSLLQVLIRGNEAKKMEQAGAK